MTDPTALQMAQANECISRANLLHEQGKTEALLRDGRKAIEHAQAVGEAARAARTLNDCHGLGGKRFSVDLEKAVVIEVTK